MNSMEGESVPLSREVAITDAVEAWLADLADSMKLTLTEQLSRILARRFTCRPRRFACRPRAASRAALAAACACAPAAAAAR